MSKIVGIWGKGGVGKSTCAASTAYYLAKDGYKVLLLSTDYVPTASRIFNVDSRGLAQVPRIRNLFIYELSPEDVVSMWIKRFGDEVYEVISSIIPVERDIINYIAGAPGIADEFMLYVLYELFQEGKYDYIIWDLPAAGDALKLLWIEKEFYSHLGDAARMYLRLKGLVRKLRIREGKSPLDLINEWRELAEEIFSMLSGPNHSALVVTTLDELSLAVTKRIVSELELFNIDVNGFIVNMVWPDSSEISRLFNERLKMQESNLNKIRIMASKLNKPYVIIPLLNFRTIREETLELIGGEIKELILR